MANRSIATMKAKREAVGFSTSEISGTSMVMATSAAAASAVAGRVIATTLA